ncbi:MAG: hypothetical protein ACU84Q_20680, partial [Gammaproteobacteria bacterium]
MRTFTASVIAIFTTLVLLAQPVTAEHHEGAEEASAPDAFVWFSRKGLGLILGGSAGGGRIHFKGDDHTFRMK